MLSHSVQSQYINTKVMKPFFSLCLIGLKYKLFCFYEFILKFNETVKQ